MHSVELFSGCGGLALGTARAGFSHLKMVEWNKDACATLAKNRSEKVEHARDWPEKIQGDVRKINWAEIEQSIALVAGGPPCQPFSLGGKHKGSDDTRDMWPEAVRAVRDLRPSVFMFENVKGLLRTSFADYLRWITMHLALPDKVRGKDETHADHLARLLASADEAQYTTLVIPVNAADFGAAQKRHRVVIAGARKDLGIELKAPSPTHSRERLLWDQWISGEYWDRHGMQRPSGPTSTSDILAVARLKASNIQPTQKPWVTVRDALVGLGDPDGKNQHVLQSGAKVYPGHTGSPLDEPAKALKAGVHGVPGGENMMVKDDGSVRYFSVREAARLQGLPDEWQFDSAWGESMRQIGNAVPTQLAEAMAKWIASAIPEEEVRITSKAA